MPFIDWVFLLLWITLIDVCFLARCDMFDLAVFNPIKNYKRWTSMNWFGVVFFTLVLNIVCPVLAFYYWFWKLCTVGRTT